MAKANDSKITLHVSGIDEGIERLSAAIARQREALISELDERYAPKTVRFSRDQVALIKKAADQNMRVVLNLGESVTISND